VAPARTYLPADEQIVPLLAAARRKGLSFDESWLIVVEGGGRMVMTNDPRPPPLAIRWPTDRDNRIDSYAAIQGTKEAYRRAFEREPATAADRAVLALFGMLGEPSAIAPAVTTPGWGHPHRAKQAPDGRPTARQPVAAA